MKIPLKIYLLLLEKQHGKGILIVDINNNNKGNCDTKYIPITHTDNFWQQSEDMLQVRKKLKQLKTKLYFYV